MVTASVKDNCLLSGSSHVRGFWSLPFPDKAPSLTAWTPLPCPPLNLATSPKPHLQTPLPCNPGLSFIKSRAHSQAAAAGDSCLTLDGEADAVNPGGCRAEPNITKMRSRAQGKSQPAGLHPSINLVVLSRSWTLEFEEELGVLMGSDSSPCEGKVSPSSWKS